MKCAFFFLIAALLSGCGFKWPPSNFPNLPEDEKQRFARCEMPLRANKCPGLSGMELQYCLYASGAAYAERASPIGRRQWLLENGCPPPMVVPERYLAQADSTVSPSSSRFPATPAEGFDPPAIRQLASTYDEFKDRTTTSSAVPIGQGLTLFLFAITRGRSPAGNVTTMRLGIGEQSDKPKHEEGASLIFLIDGRRVVAGNLSRHQTPVPPQGRILETISTSLSLKDLQTLAAATVVRGQIDSTEFSLVGQAKEDVKAFAARVGALVPAPTRDAAEYSLPRRESH